MPALWATVSMSQAGFIFWTSPPTRGMTPFFSARLSRLPISCGRLMRCSPRWSQSATGSPPENVEPILDALIEGAASLHCRPRWVFGGTRPVAERAAARGFFEKVFFGDEDLDESIAFLRGAGPRRAQRPRRGPADGPACPKAALSAAAPPLWPAQFLPPPRRGSAGSPASGVLDVISLGPDQNTQQFFFHPERSGNPAMEGRGRRAAAHRSGFPTAQGRLTAGQLPADALLQRNRRLFSPSPSCSATPSTTPGAPSRCAGTTSWTAAGPAG